ncbi:response regulator [Acaryochloris sp. 'Moss Beach']|uniref:response regulator n=1 Tax=Acaryochloris TaxID=155977 RepID=UPI001BAF8FF7|nr:MULTISPECIES: response regulator [Acaryochloris]QUY44286.1 response regulator [Acaryochloris marina S15]UJB69031.1 response regulator [Acaryochloris sp. 'Moss Beach']
MDFLSSIPDQDIASSTGSSFSRKRRPLILVVEDDQDNLLLLYHLVTSLGCNVLLAQEGRAGLAIIQETWPDLVLLDIVMPHMNGFEVLQHLRQLPEAQSVSIVAVTGLASSEEKHQLLQSGCCDYLCKPYLIDDLQSLICRHLGFQTMPQLIEPFNVAIRA